ncbi:hypothetical protein E3A20_13430, partial [Planctomyces bekefii]
MGLWKFSKSALGGLWGGLPERTKRALVGSLIALITLVVILAIRELKTSALQAHVFANMASKMTYAVGNGPSSDILFPENGPYDVTLGYSMLPGMLERLSKKG